MKERVNFIFDVWDFKKFLAVLVIKRVKDQSVTSPVSDADLMLIAYECVEGQQFEGLKIKDCKISTCMNNGSEAVVEIEKDGNISKGKATGNGPIDAAINAVRDVIGRDDAIIDNYDSVSVGKGSDAAANCTLRVKVNGRYVVSSEINTNTVMAAVKAFEKGINALGALEKLQSTGQEQLCHVAAERRHGQHRSL